jgi:hypothetical protein
MRTSLTTQSGLELFGYDGYHNEVRANMLWWETTEAKQYLDYWSVSVKEIEVLRRVKLE